MSNISNNHYHSKSFFEKLKKIIVYFKTIIKEKNTELDIFNLFKNNKRIILFLIEEKIININESIGKSIINNFSDNNEYFYFYPELKPYIRIIQEMPDNFEENRKIGENEIEICRLIREDSLNGFINYINANKVPLTSYIEPSVYETNYFLIQQKKTSLIEYAAFYGSIQIFTHLALSNANITSSIWLYAIHGNNLNLIELLASNNIEPNDNTYFEILEESIKCHHNLIAHFILTKIMKEESLNFNNKTLAYCFHYYNFSFIPDDLNNKIVIFYLCEYNYYTLVKLLLKSRKINLNESNISNFLIFTNNDINQN